MKIVVNAGHGPDTAGKRSPDGSLREYQFNSATARYLAGLLSAYEGVEILHTHSDTRDVPLKERTDDANRWPAKLYVSIHANAAPGEGWSSANGIETFVHTTRPSEAVSLAQAVQQRLVQATGLRDRGVKTADFFELRETRMPAILIECGFMTNQTEAALLQSDNYRRKCAAAICAAVVETYMLQKKDEGKVNNPTVIKERMIAVNGKLQYQPYRADGRYDYSKPGTDVRLLIVPKGQAVFKFAARAAAKVSDLVKESGADFGVNFPFINEEGEIPVGTVWNGEKYINGAHGAAASWHYLAAKDGAARIGRLNPDEYDFAVQGTPLLVENGRLVYLYYAAREETAPSITAGRSQRTFAGITAEGDLLLAVADGGTASSQGLTLEEMALYMLDKGAVWALNGDGGNRSVMADGTGALNQMQNGRASERAVHHGLLIWLKQPETTPDWKQLAVEWLNQQGLTDAVREPDAQPSWAELGEVLRKLKVAYSSTSVHIDARES